MAYTLAEAATATGKVKSTIFKACKNGKISYTLDENGHFVIDPAELHRVFPAVSKNEEFSDENQHLKTIRNAELEEGNGLENKLLQQELRFLREKLTDLERLKEDDRKTLSSRIEELRLDREDLRQERDKLLRVVEEQATSMKLLTDGRSNQAPAAVTKRGIFGRLFAR